MQRRTIRLAKAATVILPLAILWATPTPPLSRAGAPGDPATCAACHGGAGGTGSVVVTSTSGMTSYTPGATKQFTVTVSGSTGNGGFEMSARPSSNLTTGVAGNFVAGSGTQAICKDNTTAACAQGNPQYIRSTSATATPAVWTFNWTAPTGTDTVNLYIASVIKYAGNTYTATYSLAPILAPPTLAAAPTSLAFSYQTGAAVPAAQTISGTSAPGPANITASSNVSWLTVTPVSGTTPASLSASVNPAGLAAGTYSGALSIASTGAANTPLSVPVSLTVSSSASMTVAPASLAFNYLMGGAAPPVQSISISSNGSPLSYTATASGGSWLAVSPASGTTPASLGVSINTAGLTAGSYTGSVSIASAGAANSPQTVPVTLTVIPPNLTVSPASLTFSYQIGGTAPAAQSISIGSNGSALSYTVAASGGTWLSVTPASGTTPGSASVLVNTAGLAVGTYTGSVTITAAGSGNSPQTVPVSLTVASPGLLVTPMTLSFTYQLGGVIPPAQTFSVASNTSALSFTASASGGSWLTALPVYNTTPGTVNVSITPLGLAVGNYGGVVIIASSGAGNSPQIVTVNLTVTAAGLPALTATPTSLAFNYQTGGTAPAAQSVAIGSSGSALNYTISTSGGTWLSVTPASGTTPGSASVSVNTTGLAAGSYNGSVTLAATGAGNTPLTVPVTLTVTAAATNLTATPTSLAFNFQTGGTAPAAQSVAIGSSGSALNYTISPSGGTWLSATPTSGTTPGSVSVSVNTTGSQRAAIADR